MPADPTRVWIRVPAGDAGKSVLTTALERGFTTFIADAERAEGFRALGRFRLLALEGDALVEGDGEVGVRVAIGSVDEQQDALALAGKHDVVLVGASDWKIIPFENLIAAYQGTKTTLAAEAASVDEVVLFLETLEVGVDAAVFEPATPKDVLALAERLEAGESDVALSEATVTRVAPVASGDRVCVDTASLLKPGEGILVGSAASAMFLVHAETLESGYVAARPFRVNAGPVHAYALLPGNRTKYLSELKAGDDVLVVDQEGRARRVVVGRVKIETRPLLLLEAEIDGRKVATLLQNAETIRLVTPDGGAVSVVDVKPGDRVLVRVEDTGRHFGTAVKETITER